MKKLCSNKWNPGSFLLNTICFSYTLGNTPMQPPSYRSKFATAGTDRIAFSIFSHLPSSAKALRNLRLRFIKFLKKVAQFALVLYRFYFFLAQFTLALFRFYFFYRYNILVVLPIKNFGCTILRLRKKIFICAFTSDKIT